jgi:aminoglycoside phosphotransferase (APT) family kinase protein
MLADTAAMSDRPWLPEHPVDEALARALVAEQFPDLAGQPVVPVGEGWDMDVWRVGELAFRFPRRALAVPQVATEVTVLGWLADRLPVAIPRPARTGRPSERFPYPFYAHRFVAGGSAVGISSSARLALAAPLGRFLAALHALDGTAHGAPLDTMRGDPAKAAARATPRAAGTPWEAELRRRLALPPPMSASPPCLLHGDLYSRHLLVEDGALVGVIDWGDVCVGDRALDLAVVATFFPPEARHAFFAAYGPVDVETWARACFYGMCKYGLALYVYARDLGDERLMEEAALGVEHALTP